jgi:hypothetical protein
MWPRYNDNGTYLNFGSGGMFIRNNTSDNSMAFATDGRIGFGVTPAVGVGAKLQIRGTEGDLLSVTTGTGAHIGGITFNASDGSRLGGIRAHNELVGNGNALNDMELWADKRHIIITPKISGGATNVGINEFDPTERLVVDGRLMMKGSGYVSNPEGPVFGRYSSVLGYIQAPAGGQIQIWDDSTTPIAQFHDNGNVGIGLGGAAPTAKLSVNGTANNTTGVWSVYSDARLKNIIGDFNDGLNVLSKLRPKRFTYNGKEGIADTHHEQVGLIAQDVERVAPYMVHAMQGEEYADVRQLSPQALPYITINAVQALAEQNALLLEKIHALEQRINTLQTYVENVR